MISERSPITSGRAEVKNFRSNTARLMIKFLAYSEEASYSPFAAAIGLGVGQLRAKWCAEEGCADEMPSYPTDKQTNIETIYSHTRKNISAE